jgi:hypothetical protein
MFVQAQLLSLPREPSFAMSNATFDGVCMGNKYAPGLAHAVVSCDLSVDLPDVLRVLMMTPERGALACMLTNLGCVAGRKLCKCGAPFLY